jgi:hypothetical protein
MTLVPRVIELLAEQGIDDAALAIGGTIPAEDIAALNLKRLGVAAGVHAGREHRSGRRVHEDLGPLTLTGKIAWRRTNVEREAPRVTRRLRSESALHIRSRFPPTACG